MSHEPIHWRGPERRECPNDLPCPEARDVADQAVRKVFAILGVDIDVPKDVEEFRENLRFGASMRKAAAKGVMTAVGVAVSGLVLALWTGVMLKVGGK